MKGLLFIALLVSNFSFSNPPKYTWKGKEVSREQYRDSLKVEYLKYCKTLKKN